MRIVSITELEAKLSPWIDRVREGEDVLVTHRGRPVSLDPRLGVSALREGFEGLGGFGS